MKSQMDSGASPLTQPTTSTLPLPRQVLLRKMHATVLDLETRATAVDLEGARRLEETYRWLKASPEVV